MDRRLELDRASAADLLGSAYGFGGIRICERLEGGYANDLFRVVADGETRTRTGDTTIFCPGINAL